MCCWTAARLLPGWCYTAAKWLAARLLLHCCYSAPRPSATLLTSAAAAGVVVGALFSCLWGGVSLVMFAMLGPRSDLIGTLFGGTRFEHSGNPQPPAQTLPVLITAATVATATMPYTGAWVLLPLCFWAWACSCFFAAALLLARCVTGFCCPGPFCNNILIRLYLLYFSRQGPKIDETHCKHELMWPWCDLGPPCKLNVWIWQNMMWLNQPTVLVCF